MSDSDTLFVVCGFLQKIDRLLVVFTSCLLTVCVCVCVCMCVCASGAVDVGWRKTEAEIV